MGGVRRRREQAQERGQPANLAAWVLPWWLRRQIDPLGPAPEPGVLGRAGRAWTTLGLPDHEARWGVDASGAIATMEGEWSIDWWVGADDRWHVPCLEAAVRQYLVDTAPIVETRLGVPGGDVVATHWAVPSPPGPPVVRLDLTNRGQAAVAVAVALRPWGLSGLGSLYRVGLHAGALTAEGETVLRAQVPPRQAAFSNGPGGDVAAVVMTNRATAASDAVVVDTGLSDTGGWATAALVWPLAPRETIGVEITTGAGVPSAHGRRRRLGGRDRRRGQAARPGREAAHEAGVGVEPAAGSGPARRAQPRRPGADEVARGWTARVERSTRLELPPGSLATAVAVARRRLLLALGGPVSDPGPSTQHRTALVVAALAAEGCREEAATWLEGCWPDRRSGGDRRRGADRRSGGDPSAVASLLWSLGQWAATGPDPDGLVARSAEAIAEAAETAGAAGCSGPRRGPTSGPAGLTDTAWTVAGLRSAATLLAAVDEVRSASRVTAWADDHAQDLIEGLSATLRAAGPKGGAWDDAVLAGLLGVHLGVLDAHHPGAVAARRAATGRAVEGDGVAVGPPGVGVSPYLTLLLAVSSVLGGEDPSGPLTWVLSVAAPTWTWPPLVAASPVAHGPSGADDPLVSVAWWALGRALLLDDQPAAAHPCRQPGSARSEGDSHMELTLFPWVPPDWRGRNLEVHGLATAAGRASWALRWHGRRPALLWELEGDGPNVEWRAPGIDGAWSATGRRGEALLDSDGGTGPR